MLPSYSNSVISQAKLFQILYLNAQKASYPCLSLMCQFGGLCSFVERSLMLSVIQDLQNDN